MIDGKAIGTYVAGMMFWAAVAGLLIGGALFWAGGCAVKWIQHHKVVETK